MKFAPQTEEALTKAGLMEKGIYNFEVLAATEKKSKAGNDMLELLLTIWDNNGREHLVYDYLMESSGYKLRHFCYCVGLGDLYEQGKLTDTDCQGRAGKCKIYIREDKTGQYKPRNAVADYCHDIVKPVVEGTKNVIVEDLFDSEIPF